MKLIDAIIQNGNHYPEIDFSNICAIDTAVTTSFVIPCRNDEKTIGIVLEAINK